MIANTVKINGAPLNLSADHFDNEPTALDGLSISWGRTSIVDQPETSTLSMDIALPTSQAAGAPRVSGDDPPTLQGWVDMRTCSPRERG